MPAFTCPKYTPAPGASRCVHYADGGPCLRPDEFMCVEWLRANGYLPDLLPAAREHLKQVRARSPPPAPPLPPAQIGLFPRLRSTRSR